MSTIQTLYVDEEYPEPYEILVKSIPVGEREKLPNKKIESIQKYSWEDFRGLSLGFEEDWVD